MNVGVLWGVPGVLSGPEIALTARSLCDLQLPSGLIAWYPGGHADPWNHVECAMALTVVGCREQADAAYDWLDRSQLGDGSWFNYYVGASVKDPRLDTNVCAYVATGVLHHLLATGDVDAAAARWPMVERAIDFVVAHQRPDGAITWSRDATGRREDYALVTGSSSIYHALRCAVTLAERLDHHRPTWELAAGHLGHALAHHPEAFAPKDEFAMDWYYPVLGGVLEGEAAGERLDAQWDRFVLAGHGVRCVAPNDWVTAAETAEMSLALDAIGRRAAATEMLALTGRHRREDGSYYTGWAYPQHQTFPAEETTSYTAAAVLLAASALAEESAAAALFRPGTLTTVFDWPEPGCPLTD